MTNCKIIYNCITSDKDAVSDKKALGSRFYVTQMWK